MISEVTLEFMLIQNALEFRVIKILNGTKYLYKHQLKGLEETLKMYYPKVEDEKIKLAVKKGVEVYFNIKEKEGIEEIQNE